MWFVYILSCADNTFYTGITNNLEKRVNVHNSGKGAKYTRSRLPVKLVYYEEAADKSNASKREIAIKSMTRKEKISLMSKEISEDSRI